MSDQLVIRTMKDDIAGMNAPVVKPEVKHPPAPSAAFALPAKKIPMLRETVAPPLKKDWSILLSFVYVVLVCALILGAVYGYMLWTGKQVIPSFNGGESLLSEVVPSEVLAIVDYDIQSQENRDAIRAMWSNAKNNTGNSGANGDPTSLLAVADISHLYYVIMPNNPEPYLLVQKNEGTQEYVSQLSDVQTLERNGWYIVHATNIDQYSTALETGSLTEESSLFESAGSSSYLVRYAMSSAFVSSQFTSPVAGAIGLTEKDGLVFYITSPGIDGAVRAYANIAGNPPGEGVVDETNELLSLIPSDIDFAHVGINFAQELQALEDGSTRLDTTILAQPAVRQFTAQFTTPYAIYERKGADGIQDIGMILALPSSLREKITTGEPIIEQALPALIPLIVGKTLGIQLKFIETLYEGVLLRYVNIVGQTQTLDYSVGNKYLFISTSRDGMYALVDTLLAGEQGLESEDPWKSLLEKATETIKDKSFILGTLNNPALKSVLPVSSNLVQVPVVASAGKTSTGIEIQLVLLSQ